MTMYAIENAILHLSEATHLYKVMQKDTNKSSAILLKILPLLAHPNDARKMMLLVTNGGRIQMSQIKQSIGFAFGPLCGQHDGYYR